MQTIVIVDDEIHIREGLAILLEHDGREIILCGDIESAQLVIARVKADSIISDVRLTSPFRYEGLDLIQAVKRYSPESRIILMTGADTDGLEKEALDRGASAVLLKPFTLEQLEALVPAPSVLLEPASVMRMTAIDDIIRDGHLIPKVQPILDLLSEPATVHGYESLARFRTTGLLAAPDMLFEYAALKDRVVDLGLACFRSSFAHAAPVTKKAKLFMNVHPAAIGSDRLVETLIQGAQAAGVPPTRIVLEITEQASLGNTDLVESQCGALREAGFEFALDDVGIAYSHLTHIERIQPRYLKVSQLFGTGFEADPTRKKIVANVLSLARDFGCEVILEGMEECSTLDAARELGIRYGQGYFWARPEEVATALGAAIPDSKPIPDKAFLSKNRTAV